MSRVRKILAVAGLLGAIAALPAPAQAQCVPVAFPANWLQLQENAGGHTIARHVNQTLAQLINRVLNGGVPAAGSYPSTPAAQATITAALAANAIAVNAWRAPAALAGAPCRSVRPKLLIMPTRPISVPSPTLSGIRRMPSAGVKPAPFALS